MRGKNPDVPYGRGADGAGARRRDSRKGRPKKLQTRLYEAVTEVAATHVRKALVRVVAEKLQAQGVQQENFPMEEFVDLWMAGELGESFSWEDGEKYADKIVLNFTSADLEIIEEAQNVAVHGAKEILEEVSINAAKGIVKKLISNFPEEKTYEDVEIYGFRKRLDLRWGKALDSFHVLLMVSSDLFDEMARSLSKSKARKGIRLREALAGIHARALRTARAILVLLQHGMADEAYARWRTLYELSVIADFISNHGEEAAIRYMEHEIVALQSRVDNSAEWGEQLGTKAERKSIKSDYDYVVQKYGKDFARPYGWAASWCSNASNLRFVDLEHSVKGQRTAPPYKEASFQVHVGRVGLLGIGSLDGETLNTGFSNAGLHIPLMNCSLAMLQITNAALSQSPADDLIVTQVLVVLDEKIQREALKVARELRKEEKELRGE